MASRANQSVLLGWRRCCAPQHCCAPEHTAGEGPRRGAIASRQSVLRRLEFPGRLRRPPGRRRASRPASFSISTRPIQFRAFALADPYRVVVDIPQVNFQLAAGTGARGRGLVKAFRYGLVMPGGSRIVFDLDGPGEDRQVLWLEAANGQPPRLVLELEEVDRTAFVQSLAPENRPELRPAIAEANALSRRHATAGRNRPSPAAACRIRGP